VAKLSIVEVIEVVIGHSHGEIEVTMIVIESKDLYAIKKTWKLPLFF
jgi:hypothetical protein